jgi:hypothetical protein
MKYFLCFILFLAATASANKEDQCFNAFKSLMAQKSSPAVFDFYKKYSNCMDGAYAAGVSGTIVEILSNKWSDLKLLSSYIKEDPKFEKFLIQNIEAEVTGQESEVKKIVENTEKKCPSDQSELCLKIKKHAQIVLSKTVCHEFGGEKMVSLTVDTKDLVACGESPNGIVSDLNVYYGTEMAFGGDAAFKSYSISLKNNRLYIEEAFSAKKFKPHLLLKSSRSLDKCSFIEEKCIWKKEKPDPKVVLKVRNLKAKKQPMTDELWSDLMIATLNGDKEALKEFSAMGDSSDASGSESFLTYLEDLKRLKKVGCI